MGWEESDGGEKWVGRRVMEVRSGWGERDGGEERMKVFANFVEEF